MQQDQSSKRVQSGLSIRILLTPSFHQLITTQHGCEMSIQVKRTAHCFGTDTPESIFTECFFTIVSPHPTYSPLLPPPPPHIEYRFTQAAVQHERGPRNSTLRQQVAIYLQERVKQQQPADTSKPGALSEHRKSWTMKRHNSTGGSTESFPSTYYGFSNGRIGEINPGDMFLPPDMPGSRLQTQSDLPVPTHFPNPGFGFGAFGSPITDPNCAMLGSDPFQGLNRLLQAQKSTVNNRSTHLPTPTHLNSVLDQSGKNDINISSNSNQVDLNGASFSNTSTWAKALEFARIHFPQLFSFSTTSPSITTTTTSPTCTEEGQIKPHVASLFPPGLLSSHSNGPFSTSPFNPGVTPVTTRPNLTSIAKPIMDPSSVVQSPHLNSTLCLQSYLTRLMELGFSQTPCFGWPEFPAFQSFLPSVPPFVPQPLSPKQSVQIGSQPSLDSTITATTTSSSTTQTMFGRSSEQNGSRSRLADVGSNHCFSGAEHSGNLASLNDPITPSAFAHQQIYQLIMWLSTNRPDLQLALSSSELRLSTEQLSSLVTDRWDLLYCLTAVEQVYTRALTSDSANRSDAYVKLTEQLQTTWARLMLPPSTSSTNGSANTSNRECYACFSTTGIWGMCV
ncbi:unnamed protein product [Echinostoma caproni]|uniref:DET1- and DDB1-associated protein 1 n=1 Tax=Echinostoma caproni TaxID=27848 RepID=A0A183A5Q5_9TREM|nr:unnamed protein product [Echinostoma caproni]